MRSLAGGFLTPSIHNVQVNCRLYYNQNFPSEKEIWTHESEKQRFLSPTLLIVSSVSILPGFAQDEAYTQLSLPEGAKVASR